MRSCDAVLMGGRRFRVGRIRIIRWSRRPRAGAGKRRDDGDAERQAEHQQGDGAVPEAIEAEIGGQRIRTGRIGHHPDAVLAEMHAREHVAHPP